MAEGALRILVVDDEPAHTAAVQRAFQSASDVTLEFASTLKDYRQLVAVKTPDLALVDLNLPDGRAVELLTFPPEQGDFPVVVMTSHGNEDTAVEAMKAGAIDYVVKSPQAFAEMPHTVERVLREWTLRRTSKRAEAALQESEERYRALFEKSHDALMTIAPPEWRYSSGNPAACALFGALHNADFCSRTPLDYSPEHQPDGRASREMIVGFLTTALREGASSFEWMHRRLTGEGFPATVLLTRIEVNGRALLQATVRDETEKTRLQASVAQSDRLASMGVLAAGVAHEINNPLTYVQFNIESLARDLPNLATAIQRCCKALRDQVGNALFARIAGKSADMLEPAMLADVVDRANEALEGTQRIKVITRGLGKFSRVEDVELAWIDPIPALSAAINMANNEVRYRARLQKELAPLPEVWATDGKLSQVFLNLIVNAAHAIDVGAVENNQITIRAWAENDQVFIEIADTGKGIPTEDLERIFEPFYTTKAVGVGSGLGLPICKSILNGLGGGLSVQSQVGKGSQFLVTLLAIPAQSTSQGDTTTTEEPLGPVERGRILIVDDEESVRKSLARLFGRDHELVTAGSGAEACVLLEQDVSFEVVLCDLMMTPMSGVELHAWMVEHYPNLARRVVFLSGGAFTPKVSEYLASVGNLRFEKPFDGESLRRTVSELVRVEKAGV